jgi:hypothetical protein
MTPGSDDGVQQTGRTYTLEQIDSQIYDLLRAINWHRIARTLALGGPVTAGARTLLAICLLSVGVGYTVLMAREALSSAMAAALAVAGVVLFLILAALRTLVLRQLRPLAVQTGGKLANDISARQARELAAEAREYYARHGQSLNATGWPALRALHDDLQARRAGLAAECRNPTPGHRLLTSQAQSIALSALLLWLCSFAPAFLVQVGRPETPLTSTTAGQGRPSPAALTGPRPSLAPNYPVRSAVPAPAIPEVTPVPLTISVYDRLRNFVVKHVAAESSRDLDRSVGDYFGRVDYFDDGMLSAEQIRADKEVYFKRWPSGHETITGEIKLTKVAVGAWHATFGTAFRVENGLNDWMEGDATNDYEIEFVDGRPVITAQKVNVTRRQKSNPARAVSTFDENAIAQFVAQFQRTEMSHDLDAIMFNYAPQVDYFDDGKVGQAFIRKDKADYFHHWPQTQYQVGGRVISKESSPQHYHVTFPLTFQVQSETGERVVGDAENALDLIEVTGQLKIVGEKSKVLHRNKEVNPGVTPLLTTGETRAPNPPPTINARHYNGRGHIYKVPELKNLVGKKLDNAWLYGDFMLKSWNGNSATFSTMAMILLPGGGSTKVDIEFAGGVFISAEANRLMNDPQMPQTGMCRVNVSDPIELIWVGRINGQLVVRAKSAAAFKL